MSPAFSISARRRYGLARVCQMWEVPRSTVYARRERTASTGATLRRRGPKPKTSDASLLSSIREVSHSEWIGEGYRKVWARLRVAGVRTSKRRVLRLMRENGLLAPTRVGGARGPRVHDGTIIPARPDERWGTDATTTWTGDGTATIFVVVDHCTAECLGLHAARPGTRFEALEALREGVREVFGSVAQDVAVGAGLELRHDHGSQFMSDDYQRELTFLGIASSPSFVRAPEGNGCAERFIKTLKEQLLWMRDFATVEELCEALRAFKDRYNRTWLIERHGHRAPRDQRRRLLEPVVDAA